MFWERCRRWPAGRCCCRHVTTCRHIQPDTDCGRCCTPPAEAASVDERIDFLHQQLDSIGGDADVLNGLVLLGSGTHERLQGGAANHFSCLLYSNYSRTSRLLHHVDAEGSS